MAYDFDDGAATDFIAYATMAKNFDPATNGVTYSVWTKQETTNTTSKLIAHTLDSGSGAMNFRNDSGTSGRIHVVISMTGGSVGNKQAKSTGHTTTGTWIHWGFTDDGSSLLGSDIAIYKDGVAQSHSEDNDETAGGVPRPYDELVTGRHDTSGLYYDGFIAEVAMWSEEFTAAKMLTLAAGYSPLVFPVNLKFYAPMIRNEDDRIGSAGVVNGTPVVSAHPPIIYPARPRTWPTVAAAAGSVPAILRSMGYV